MKRPLSFAIIPALVFGLAFNLTAIAQPRSAQQAWDVALNFLSLHQGAHKAHLQSMQATRGRMKLKKQGRDDRTISRGTPYYIYADTINGQMVIVSGDKRMPTILGYSPQAWSTDLPAPLTDLLEGYEQMYAALPDESGEADPSQPEEGIGTKLLTTMEWSQERPFRSLCPEGMPSGCVATALGIVMGYHKWPEHGRGKHSYTWRDSVITANFHESHYDWSKMSVSNFNLTHATNEEKAEVSRFIKDVCTAIETSYRDSGSSASMSNALLALKYYFHYSFKAHMEKGAAYSPDDWEALLRKEIDEGRPVVYTAYENNSGHAFVIDGYSGHLFHANFGWGGHFNGYYELGNMMGYTDNPMMLTGIEPERVHPYAIPTLDDTSNELSAQLGTNRLEAGKWCTVNVSNFHAYHFWEGSMRLALYDSRGKMREVLETFSYDNHPTRSEAGPNSYTFTPSISADAGDYLAFSARQEGEEEWFEVCNDSGEAMHIMAAPSSTTGIADITECGNMPLLCPGRTIKTNGKRIGFTLPQDGRVNVYNTVGTLITSHVWKKGPRTLDLPTQGTWLLRAE